MGDNLATRLSDKAIKAVKREYKKWGLKRDCVEVAKLHSEVILKKKRVIG